MILTKKFTILDGVCVITGGFAIGAGVAFCTLHAHTGLGVATLVLGILCIFKGML